MSDFTDQLLQAFVLQEAQKNKIANASPYSGLSQGANEINKLVVGASGNPNYSTGEKITAGLIGGLVGGGLEHLNTDWQGRAEQEYQNAVLAGFGGKSAERDLLPRSIFDSAEQRGGLLKARSVFDSVQGAQKAKADLMGKAREAQMAADPRVAQGVASGDFGVFAPKQTSTPGVSAEDATPGEGIGVKVDSPFASTLQDRAFEAYDSGKFETLKDAREFILEQDDRIIDLEDKTRGEIAKLPAFQKLDLLDTGLSEIATLANDNTSTSDFPFLVKFVSSLDGTAAREGEVAIASGTNPLIHKWVNIFNKETAGGSKLGVDIKRQMVEELWATRDNLLDIAERQSREEMATAERRGLDPRSVTPIDLEKERARKFDLFPTEAQTQTTQATGPIPAQVESRLKQIAKHFPNTPEGRAKFKAETAGLLNGSR